MVISVSWHCGVNEVIQRSAMVGSSKWRALRGNRASCVVVESRFYSLPLLRYSCKRLLWKNGSDIGCTVVSRLHSINRHRSGATKLRQPTIIWHCNQGQSAQSCHNWFVVIREVRGLEVGLGMAYHDLRASRASVGSRNQSTRSSN